ncbi:tetratricopeptide repeat protein [Metallibacterium scheffleri]
MMPLLATSAGAETASQVFKQDAPSVVVVLTYTAAGKLTELGSGVKLPDGTVATNCHVLKDGTRYGVRYEGKDYHAQLDKADWNRDVCSLSVPGLPAPPVTLGSTRTLQVGASVYAIGTPEGLQRTLSQGIVSSLRPVGGGSYIQTTAAISPGSSGGGLFDDHGRLLGLTSFFISKGQQLNFALPVEWIEALPQHTMPRVAPGANEVEWLNRVASFESAKDWQGLQVFAEHLIKVQPHSEIGWFALGESNAHLGHYVQAIVADRQALQINPQDADAWNNLGSAYDSAGQYAQAIDADRQALRINPRYAKAWSNLGVAYQDTGQFARAIDAERQALRINPQDVVAWNNLGAAYQGAGQFARAIDAERQALRINPRNAKAWNNLGAASAHAGQFAQAIDAFRQALRINPQSSTEWFYLGLVYSMAGQQDQALAVYQHLKTIDPAKAQKLFDRIVPK